MHCTPSPCSTSASWPSSNALIREFPRRRDSVSFQFSRIRTSDVHPGSFLDDEEIENSVCFPCRRPPRASAFLHSLGVFRTKDKSTRSVACLVAVIGVSVECETASANDVTSCSSALSSQLLAGSASEAPISAREQVTGGPAIDWRQWTWVKEEVRVIVVQFLESRGLSETLSGTAVREAPTFITHLLSLLRSCYPARYHSGKELTGSAIRCVLLPYLESLAETRRKDVDGVCGDFSSAPDLARFVPPLGSTHRILSAYPLLRARLVDGQLPPSLSYCLGIGLNPAQVEATMKKFPPITGYTVEGKIEKVVDFILSLDVSSSLIRSIMLKRPQLFGCNVEENLRPSSEFLENLGVERKRWGRILVAFPHMLTYSSAKSALVFNYLLEIGVSNVGAGKILSRFPHAVGYSVELKLKPMAAYFRSLGIEDFSRVITRSPQTLGLSLEGNIKPTVDFFMSTLGFSTDEMALVLNRFPQVLGLNVEHNLQPKWRFFLEMNRSKTQLVEFPQYFGYSLENRILPRYKIVAEKQIRWTLNRMLSTSKEVFQRLTNT